MNGQPCVAQGDNFLLPSLGPKIDLESALRFCEMKADSDIMEIEVNDANERHLRTDHLLANLKERTISSGTVTLFSQAIIFVLTLVSTMILARLLAPRDFGLIAMVSTVTAFVGILKDAGLSTATMQREGITHAQVSNLFWINLGVSIGMGLVVACLTPVLAWFYKEPKLIGLALALSTTFPLNGSTVQHQALLSRQMRFKALALIQVGSLTVGILTGVLMALLGSGYWSLAGLNIAQAISNVVITWGVCRWRPQLPVRHCGTRSLLNFGVNMTGANLVRCLTQNMDSLLIGRFYGAAGVGLYSRAVALLQRPLNQFMSPLTTVFEPALARLQYDSERYRRTFLQAYNVTALAGVTGAGLVLPLAHPITLVLLGQKWEKTAAIFAGFSFAALYIPLVNTAGWLFISQGRAKDWLIVSSVCGIISILGICVGLHFGPAGVAMAWSLSGLFLGLPYFYYQAGRQGPVRTMDLWLGFFRHLPVWLVVFGTTWITYRAMKDSNDLIQLLVCVPVGLFAAGFITYLLPYTRESVLFVIRTATERVAHRKVNVAPLA